MKTLFIAWKEINTPKWLTVARLCYNDKKYIFCYTKGAQLSDTFVPFGRFLNLNTIYTSDKLFSMFENRILRSSRPEFKDFINWLSLEEKFYDPLDILALTEGKKETDNLEIFPYPIIDKDNILTINFFTHGLAYTDICTKENLNSLQSGDRLYLCNDPQNHSDPDAILLRSNDPIHFVGYCPRYLVKDFNILLNNSRYSNIQVIVKKINPSAPYSYRVLCTMKAKCPPDFLPFSDDQFLPIPDMKLLECSSICSKMCC